MERIVITKSMIGLLYMQVCCASDATDEEILAHCNRLNPAGTTQGWCDVIREGEGKPVACADDPERLHILIAC